MVIKNVKEIKKCEGNIEKNGSVKASPRQSSHQIFILLIFQYFLSSPVFYMERYF